MTLPQRLKYLRLAESACGKKLPMSQKELGAKMGRNEWVISKMEAGVHASLSEQNLTRWKQAMGLEKYAWLLTCGVEKWKKTVKQLGLTSAPLTKTYSPSPLKVTRNR